ncbi:hypothetical protein [Paraherbaspirillum soli]|uniref:Uncharacterized protein n=1 Tax=Paraherbaspirillum soli TaxID=631222 RepID=A0ABW0M957_9BURK
MIAPLAEIAPGNHEEPNDYPLNQYSASKIDLFIFEWWMPILSTKKIIVDRKIQMKTAIYRFAVVAAVVLPLFAAMQNTAAVQLIADSALAGGGLLARATMSLDGLAQAGQVAEATAARSNF